MYLFVNENWWDVEKISSRLDNGISNAQCTQKTQIHTEEGTFPLFAYSLCIVQSSDLYVNSLSKH